VFNEITILTLLQLVLCYSSTINSSEPLMNLYFILVVCQNIFVNLVLIVKESAQKMLLRCKKRHEKQRLDKVELKKETKDIDFENSEKKNLELKDPDQVTTEKNPKYVSNRVVKIVRIPRPEHVKKDADLQVVLEEPEHRFDSHMAEYESYDEEEDKAKPSFVFRGKDVTDDEELYKKVSKTGNETQDII